MKNLNKTVHGKILLQAEEAKALGFSKLAADVLAVIGPVAHDESEEAIYSAAELEDNLKNKLWKIAVDFISYHDLESVDIQKIEDTVNALAAVVTAEMENILDVDGKIGPLEPKLPGESK